MFRKPFIFLFAIYFLLSTVGISISAHTCGGITNFSVWGLNLSDTAKCNCHHDEIKNHSKRCCSETTKVFKAKTDGGKNASSIAFNKFDNFTLLKYSCFSQEVYSNSYNLSYTITHSPPISEIPLYLRVRLLLI